MLPFGPPIPRRLRAPMTPSAPSLPSLPSPRIPRPTRSQSPCRPNAPNHRAQPKTRSSPAGPPSRRRPSWSRPSCCAGRASSFASSSRATPALGRPGLHLRRVTPTLMGGMSRARAARYDTVTPMAALERAWVPVLALFFLGSLTGCSRGPRGAPCKKNGDCEEGLKCLSGQPYNAPPAYCTTRCDPDTPCPDGWKCVTDWTHSGACFKG
jgi:hypothetical protein